MRLSHFFISRPIFAIVLSLFVTIVGAVAYFRLPVAQYPEVAPPTIQVTASYPGASAEVLSNCVVPRRLGQGKHVSAAPAQHKALRDREA
jgi:multidrug efflux pump subunit AcrB